LAAQLGKAHHAASHWSQCRLYLIEAVWEDALPLMPTTDYDRSVTVGAPPTYDIPKIEAMARDLAANGVDDRQAWFFEKVRDECDDRHIKTPGQTRFAEIVGPIYKQAKKTQ
jgi:hypothetical protein